MNPLGKCRGNRSITLRPYFHLHVIPYFVYIAHFKNSLVEVLCLWKNLCSRKNQERKKVLGKKKKEKKKKISPKKKERVPFCKEKKNFLCKRDL